MHENTMQEMAGVMHREFHELELDGSNYLPWAMDAKIALESRKLGSTIITPVEGAGENPHDSQIYSFKFLKAPSPSGLKVGIFDGRRSTSFVELSQGEI